MTRFTPLVLTWRHFAIVWAICTLTGATVGIVFLVMTEVSVSDFAEWLFLAPFVILNALGVATVSALLGSLVGAIPLLVMHRHLATAPVLTWRSLGALAGAVIGALPVCVIFGALVVLGEEPSLRSAGRVALLPASAGGLSGLFVGWWYRAGVIGRRVLE